jgi:hypothetical protein
MESKEGKGKRKKQIISKKTKTNKQTKKKCQRYKQGDRVY